MRLALKTALLLLFFLAPLLGQSASPQVRPQTFHVEGTISSEWDVFPAGVLIPRSWYSKGESLSEGVGTNGPYVPLPRTQITFSGEEGTKTLTVDERGFYQADLAFGTYKMRAHGPMVRPYVRLFRVKSPAKIVLNGTLYWARTTCDILVGGDAPEQQVQETKDACGGEDSFPVPSKDGTPFQLYIQYPKRRAANRGYIYTSDRAAEPDVAVCVAYNLFSLEADTVLYDVKTRTILATGHVVTADGSGRTRHADSAGFTIRDGEVLPLNQENRKYDPNTGKGGVRGQRAPGSNQHIVGDEGALQEGSSESIMAPSLALVVMRPLAKRR